MLTGTPPLLLAGLLYLGSGLGLFSVRAILRWNRPIRSEAPVRGRDWIWLFSATFFGGVLAPALLMMGLSHSDATSTSLLLNLEGVFTALAAWFIFGENFDKRIMLGMIAIVAGSVLLSWSGSSVGGNLIGALFVVTACLSWAIDNNLTKKIAANDALQIAMTKGIVAGIANTLLAVSIYHFILQPTQVFFAGLIGFLGYGVSLVCFVLSLRSIGAARTSAYFSLAPFVGAGISLAFQEVALSWQMAAAAVLMGFGVWLHLSERHEHEHQHLAIEHEHRHTHDDHHQHDHSPGDSMEEPHSHRHSHQEITHKHQHFPDVHHTHSH